MADMADMAITCNPCLSRYLALSWQMIHTSISTMAKSPWSKLTLLPLVWLGLPGAGGSPPAKLSILLLLQAEYSGPFHFCNIFFSFSAPLRTLRSWRSATTDLSPVLTRLVCTLLMYLLPTHFLYSISFLFWGLRKGKNNRSVFSAWL
jgi:hypothetical protein